MSVQVLDQFVNVPECCPCIWVRFVGELLKRATKSPGDARVGNEQVTLNCVTRHGITPDTYLAITDRVTTVCFVFALYADTFSPLGYFVSSRPLDKNVASAVLADSGLFEDSVAHRLK